MTDDAVVRAQDLSTAHVADACVRAGVPVRTGPAGLRPVAPGVQLAGRALPARHAGSVDVFLEALEHAAPGEVLVVDDGGRTDRACVGDLVVLECAAAGLAGVVVWGLHRDTADLVEIGLPVLSLGAHPSGPLAVEPRADDALDVAHLGPHRVARGDLVVADDDGVALVARDDVTTVLPLAEAIRDTERRQAALVRDGRTLRDQLRFTEYLEARRTDPALTFRAHLRTVSGAIEE